MMRIRLRPIFTGKCILIMALLLFCHANTYITANASGGSSESQPLPSIVGFVKTNDTQPEAGQVLDWWGSTSAIGINYLNRSIGIDVNQAKSIGRIELWDSDVNSLLTQSSYSIYTSDDNTSYAKINDWEFSSQIVNNRLVHTFFLSGVKTRYIKVHTTDSNYDFVLNNPQVDVKAFAESTVLTIAPLVGFKTNDTQPTSGQIAEFWGTTDAVGINYLNRSVGMDLGRSHKIGRIELWDNDNTTLLNRSNYSIYISEDNTSYVQTNNWNFNSLLVNNRVVHIFTFAGLNGLETRYIKIHTANSNYDFILNNPQNDVKVYNQVVTSPYLPATVGFIKSADIQPETGRVLDWWGNEAAIGINFMDRSLGIGLGLLQQVDEIELWDSNAASLLNQSSYTVYSSDDNITYSQVTNWTFNSLTVDSRLVHRFSFTDLKARYVKIHTADSNYDFILNNPQVDVKVYSHKKMYYTNPSNQLKWINYYYSGHFYRMDFFYDLNGNVTKQSVSMISN